MESRKTMQRSLASEFYKASICRDLGFRGFSRNLKPYGSMYPNSIYFGPKVLLL